MKDKKYISEKINNQLADTQIGIRLNKFLSDSGVCSRREADRLIESGKVFVDNRKAVMGEKINLGQKVSVDGKIVTIEENRIILAFNKPVGIECTCDKNNPDNIIDYINYPQKLIYIGRLDKNSSGLLLMTNDGDMADKISRSANGHEKEYIVKVNKKMNEDFIEKMSGGVKILNTITKPCTVTKISDDTFKIILSQGLNRQIRRMCETFSYKVISLKRIRIMNVNLGKLKEGTYRNLTNNEISTLISSLKKN